MKRWISILLVACLLAALFAGGCTTRSAAGAEPKPTAAPVITPEPTPSPSPSPTPEPTPCPHLTWENGVCADCGEECAHENWEDGRCAVCAMPCPHPSHDEESRVCARCGLVVPHTYVKNKCTLCGAEPVYLDEILPRELFEECDRKGRVEELSYTTQDYMNAPPGGEGAEIEKKLYVYLPYGYDPEEKYDMMVLLHGMGGGEGYWLVDKQDYLYPQEDFVYTTDLLDNLFEAGWCKKMIIATPTFYRYSSDMGFYFRNVDEAQFLQELRNDILPLLLMNYPTYAEEPTLAGMAAQRQHFAYAGLSMGSIYAFTSIMPNCLDLFGWYGCFSGSDGYMNQLAAVLNAPENADKPIYYFYNSIGNKDTMFYLHMGQYQDLVRWTEGLTDGENAAFTEIKGAQHLYTAWATGLYNFLPVVFSLPETQ